MATEKLNLHDKLTTLKNTSQMAIPSNPKLLSKYIKTQQTGVDLGKALLKHPDITPELYQAIYQKTQQVAELHLDAEVKLGQYFKTLPTSQGKRTDKKAELVNYKNNKSKKEILKELGLSQQQANVLENLTPEIVEQAKAQARAERLIVNRTMVQQIASKEKNRRQNKKFEVNGIYDENDTPDINSFTNKQPIYYTQLMASVGVGEEFLEQIGLYPTVVNEYEEKRCKWYKERHKNSDVIVGKLEDHIDEIVQKHIKHKNTLLLASPVCVNFSKAGKQNYEADNAKLILSVLEVLKRVNTVNQFVLIENVPGFLSAIPNWPELGNDKSTDEHKINLGTYVKQELEKLGYTVNISIVNGADYDTPQNRERAFILGSKNGLWKFPKKSKKRIMLWEAIGHLPSLKPGEQYIGYNGLHRVPKLEQWQIDTLIHTPTGCSAQDNPIEFTPKEMSGYKDNGYFKSHFQRMCWDAPAGTVMRKNGSVGGFRTVHPGRPNTDDTWTDPRPLSILELLIVDGLDENYFIPKWATDELIRDVIGDCLLPKVNLALCLMIPGRK